MAKKVLFLTNELYPYLNANSEIAYRIARYLKANYDCDITMMGYIKSSEENNSPDPSGLSTIIIHSITKYYYIHLRFHTPFERITHYIRYPDCFRFFLRRKFRDHYAECDEFIWEIKKALKHENYDCIVAFSFPYTTLQALTRLKTDIPFIAYKLDPWSTNYTLECKERHNIDERNADLAAAAIITTDLIKKEYNATNEILQKIQILKFPNIIDYGNAYDDMFCDSNYIHCLFAGRFYHSIREPYYTFALFERLLGKKIILHIYGQFYGEYLPEEKLPQNVIYHGNVSSDEIIRYMKSADVLVNIGNSIPNMMPSKLLTYISLGKPILNIVKNCNCPTLPYLQKYPLGLSILETSEPTIEDVERVEEFIMSKKGETIPFDTIKELYYDCTPEYVCGKVYELISDVIDTDKGRNTK